MSRALFHSTAGLRPLDRDSAGTEGGTERGHGCVLEGGSFVGPVPAVVQLDEEMWAGLMTHLVVVDDGQGGEVVEVYGGDGVGVVLEKEDLALGVVEESDARAERGVGGVEGVDEESAETLLVEGCGGIGRECEGQRG